MWMRVQQFQQEGRHDGLPIDAATQPRESDALLPREGFIAPDEVPGTEVIHPLRDTLFLASHSHVGAAWDRPPCSCVEQFADLRITLRNVLGLDGRYPG